MPKGDICVSTLPVVRTIPGRSGNLSVRLRPGCEPGARHPWLVFLDGLACDGFVFTGIWERLPAQVSWAHLHYRGHGLSAPPGTGSFAVRDLVEDVRSLRAELDHSVILVGHSLGVQVALEAALQGLPGLCGMVLMNGTHGRATSTFKGSDWLTRLVPRLLHFFQRFPRAASFAWRAVPERLSVEVGKALGDVPENMISEQMLPYFRHLRQMPLERFLALLLAAEEHTTLDRLSAVPCPAWVVSGGRDTFTPSSLAEEIVAALPFGRSIHFPELTHLLPLEAPGVIAEELVRALSGFGNRKEACELAAPDELGKRDAL